MEKTRESQTPSALSNSIPKLYPLAMKRTVHMKSSAFPHFPHFPLFRFPPTGDVCFKTQISTNICTQILSGRLQTAKLSSPGVSPAHFQTPLPQFPRPVADTIPIGERFSSTVS